MTCSADGSDAPSLGNAPQYSIVTRGNASGDGIRAVSGALTPARGGVFVEGGVDVSSGAELYVVQGDVFVRGTCSGTIDVEDDHDVYCPNAAQAAPGDPSGISQAPAVPSAALTGRTPPACPGDGSPIVFQPGRYTDLTGLKALTTSCSSNTFHFPPESDGSPGFFHFDFTGGGEWSFGQDETVVGGTLTGALATIHTVAAGAKCDDDQQGAQLVFSGESRVGLGSGAVMELCPPLFDDDTTQRVTVYGPKPTTGAPVTLAGVVGTATSTSGNATFSNPVRALADDDSWAEASVPDRKSATLTVSGFDLSSVPSTATVTEVKVTVEHRESAGPTDASLDVRIEGGTGSNKASATVATATRSATGAVETFDLSSTFDAPAELTNFQVALTADNPTKDAPASTQGIDVVTVSVTYAPAGVAGTFAPSSGCVATGATCPLIKTQGQAVFASKGTIYAPLAMLDIQLVNVTHQVFGRGVIVRRLDTYVTASIACNIDPLPDSEEYDSCYAFQLPRNRTMGDNVVFTATHEGRTLLRAYVNFAGAAPVVKRWSSVNEAA